MAYQDIGYYGLLGQQLAPFATNKRAFACRSEAQHWICGGHQPWPYEIGLGGGDPLGAIAGIISAWDSRTGYCSMFSRSILGRLVTER